MPDQDTRGESAESARRSFASESGPANPDHKILARWDTEEQRRRINLAARNLLRQRGELPRGVVFHERGVYLEVAEGERLRFTRSRHSEGIEAGMLASVIGFEPCGWRNQLDNGRTHTIPSDLQDSTAYGYALSIAAAPGMTVDRTYLMASPNLDSAATQVTLTRHRHSLHIGYSRAAFRESSALFSALARDERSGREPEDERMRVSNRDPATPSSSGHRSETPSARDDRPGDDIGRRSIGGRSAAMTSNAMEDRLERLQDAQSERMRWSLERARREASRSVPDRERQPENVQERDQEIDR